MSETAILDRIAEVVGDVLGIDPPALKPETTARDVEGWDSISSVSIMIALEQEFGVRFRTGEIAGLADIGALERMIRVHLDQA